MQQRASEEARSARGSDDEYNGDKCGDNDETDDDDDETRLEQAAARGSADASSRISSIHIDPAAADH